MKELNQWLISSSIDAKYSLNLHQMLLIYVNNWGQAISTWVVWRGGVWYSGCAVDVIIFIDGLAHQTQTQGQVLGQIQLSPQHKRRSYRLIIHRLHNCFQWWVTTSSSSVPLCLVRDKEWGASVGAVIQRLFVYMLDVSCRLSTAGSHYRIYLSIQSNDPEYRGKAIVTLGPIELDVNLKV